MNQKPRASQICDNVNPDSECPFCPRLVDYRLLLRKEHPDYFNAPVPNFGLKTTPLAIIGLAPGRHGANRTGRVFTGDYAGDFLFTALEKHSWARGPYRAKIDDGFELTGCRIINALKCVPPQNKPETEELENCRPFLKNALEEMKNLKAILALGHIAHSSVLKAFGLKLSAFPFGHAKKHALPQKTSGKDIAFFDSYHCSRYNTATGRLTSPMFDDVLNNITAELSKRKQEEKEN